VMGEVAEAKPRTEGAVPTNRAHAPPSHLRTRYKVKGTARCASIAGDRRLSAVSCRLSGQAQPPVLNLGTPVHDDVQAPSTCPGRGRLVDHAQLHPHGPRADGDGLIHVRSRFPPEDVHHVDPTGNRRQVRISPFTQDLVDHWVHGNDLEPELLQERCHVVARPARSR